jgi:integrase/recombinase XerD
MTATSSPNRRVSVYQNGQPYKPAVGRFAPQARVEDHLAVGPPVVQGRPSQGQFVRRVVDEMRLRFYERKTIKAYRHALASFLRWFGAAPHLATREDLRRYLLYMVDAGLASGTVSNHLSAIRTIFDKFCGRHITLGLVTPRRPKRLPVILSPEEIKSLLQAATSLRDKLILGLMYATGMRVSEVVRVRWRDIDFDRRLINVWQGKGRTDRQVTLPTCYEPLLKELSQGFTGDDFLFPSESAKRGGGKRHLSSRTAERIMERAVRIAGIKKKATPHSLRHSFATHSFENGCDIRRIQKALGHVRLETTTIYVKVARPSEKGTPSPLDKLYHIAPTASSKTKPVGRLKIHFQQQSNESRGCRRAKVTLAIHSRSRPIYFTGILASEVRPGYVTLQIPPLENWEEPLRWLSRSQRERFEEPEFYETLQREISTRLLRLRATPCAAITTQPVPVGFPEVSARPLQLFGVPRLTRPKNHCHSIYSVA